MQSRRSITSINGKVYRTGDEVQEGVTVNDSGDLNITLLLSRNGKTIRRSRLNRIDPDSYQQIWAKFSWSPFPEDWSEPKGSESIPDPEPNIDEETMDWPEEIPEQFAADEPEPEPMPEPTFESERMIPCFNFIWRAS